MGVARLLLAGLAVLGLLVLVFVGIRALASSLDAGTRPVASPSGPPGEGTVATPSQSQSAIVPTVLIECLQERCQKVFVRIPGGDVLLDRELSRGERAGFTDEKLDVVLADSASVRVEVNGEPRTPEEPGGREAFTVTREDS
ncbi:hypothetical protein [Thermocatellispora tengchongensis]